VVVVVMHFVIWGAASEVCDYDCVIVVFVVFAFFSCE
jgi:hypothetical protein